ncbi:helix-turn-helix transcriptional regulator [Paenibacillus lautus]|uniref:helix-turn-helix transcriptional regulator n=1 Tax=Paenibacillus lautus TaxID=1401 RepID=UPI003D2DE104
MNIKICSIKQKELITPGSIMQYEFRQGTYAYFETMGVMELHFGNEAYELQSGHAFIGRKFEIKNVQDTSLFIRGFIFDCNSQLIFFNQPRVLMNTSLCGVISEIYNNTQCLVQLSKIISRCFPGLLKSMANDIVVENALPEQNKGKMDKRLILINRYIRENFMQPLTLQQLADLISCNPIYLSNTYSKVFRISPMKYVRNLRMEKAAELLVIGNLNIRQIANELGYVSASQFSDLFKKHYQMTPSQYKVGYALLNHNHTNEGGPL